MQVTVYARWEPGLPLVEQHEGFRLVRAPWTWQLAVPGLAGLLGSRVRGIPPHGWERAHTTVDAPPPVLPALPAGTSGSENVDGDPAPATAASHPGSGGDVRPGGAAASRLPSPRRLARRLVLRPLRAAGQALREPFRLLEKYPVRPLAWARALERVAEPADVWHGMWAGSLPALDRLRRRHGGRSLYDSRDVYMESRELATAPRILRRFMGMFERRWARRADAIISVNRAYADLVAAAFDVPPPPVVMNCPEAWTPPEPRPDRFRDLLALPATTSIVLYQGQLISDRGIEQAMDAILDVPEAMLVLLGHGPWHRRLRNRSEQAPYRGRVTVLAAVRPSELVSWTASADVCLMPIQPTSLNHRYSTPQKLFESIAAGVPVVASDLPGMAGVVREIEAGALCDPTSPTSIAEAIRSVLAADEPTSAARRARILAAAHERYNWEAQADVLFDVYGNLLALRPGST